MANASPSRLCIACRSRHAQYGVRPYCLTCAPDAPELGLKRFHRVQAVDMHKTLKAPTMAPPLEPPNREIVIGHCHYEVVWDGRGPLPGNGDTPRQLGCSLLDSSALVRP